MLDSVLSRRLGLAAVLFLIVGGVAFFQSISFRFWEGTLKGPYSGFPVAPMQQAKIDSQLELPRRHLLEVSNAYTNAGADEWPLVALKNANGEVLWAQVLQPIVKHPDTNYTPFVRDLKLLKWKSGSDEIKVIISCYWGAGGAEKGVIYLEKKSLAFKRFGLSW